MSVPLSEFRMTHLYREDGRWRVAGSGLETHCPKVFISSRTANKILNEAQSLGMIRQDYTRRGDKVRVVEFMYNSPNKFPALLNRQETAALEQSLATELSRAADYLRRGGATARRYNPTASKSNSLRALRRQPGSRS